MSKKTNKTAKNISETMPWYRRLPVQTGLVFALAFLLYANTLGHEYALDDAIVITDNEFVQEGVSGIGDIFAYDTFRGFYKDDRGVDLVSGGRYRPLTLAMFAVERTISEGPGIHHFFNAFWYGGLCLVIFFFVRDLARSREGMPWWFAVAVAALFAAHPLHTEVVANIKGRDEIMAMLGAMLGLWLTWRAAGRGSMLGAAAGAGLFLLGCLSKENTITFFAVIPVALLLFGSKGKPTAKLFYFLPVAIASATFLAVRYAVIGTGIGGEPVLELMNNPFVELKGGNWQPLSAGSRFATIMHTLWQYLVLLVAPFDLVHDYYPRAIPVKSWGQITPWLGLLGHAALGIFALLKWRNWPFFSFGVLIYLASLSIVSNVLFSVGTNMSERFLFMPSFGFILAGVALLVGLTKKYGDKAGYILPVIVAVFSVLTILRNPVWQNDYILFTTDVKKQPNSAKLLNAASGARLARYADLKNGGQTPPQFLLTESLRDLTRAQEIHPSYRSAYQLRGNANYYLKNYDAAIADYDRAFDLSGGNADITKNLVIGLTTAAEEGGKAGKPISEIIAYLSRAEQLAPNDYNVLRLQGVANGMSGRTPQALDYFRRALAIKPNDADALWNYGVALYTAGQTDAAETQFAKSEQVQPGIRAERRQ